jgi:hypothetical protein
MRGRRDVGALEDLCRQWRESATLNAEKQRTPCPAPRTRMPREVPCALKRTSAPQARVRPRANSMYVQVKRQRAHARQQLIAPASRTAQQAVRARAPQHRHGRFFSLRWPA